MGMFSGLFKSRDKPENRTSGSSYSFLMGSSTSGKYVNERSAMQMTAVYSCVRIESILTNEKYKGDALLQKVYTTDFLTKKKKKNEGEVPQYYVEGNHEAIIPPDIFDNVQVLMQARHPGKNRRSCTNIYSGKIKCGDCGSWYGSKVWHSNDKYRRVIWRCNHKYDSGEKCTTPHLDEEAIKAAFIKALNILNTEKQEVIAAFEEIRDTAFRTDELQAEAGRLNGELNAVATMIQECVDVNARVAQDQEAFNKEFSSLEERLDALQKQIEENASAIAKKQAQKQMMMNFIKELKKLPEQIDTFDEDSWCAMLNHITVYSKSDIRVTFKNGMEIQV